MHPIHLATRLQERSPLSPRTVALINSDWPYQVDYVSNDGRHEALIVAVTSHGYQQNGRKALLLEWCHRRRLTGVAGLSLV